MITHVPQMIPQHCLFSALPRCSFLLSPHLLLLSGAVASVACHAGPTAPITCGCSDRALLAVNTKQPCSSSHLVWVGLACSRWAGALQASLEELAPAHRIPQAHPQPAAQRSHPPTHPCDVLR